MSLNIKNPETFRLAHELAEATGETVTGAVTTAVRERLEAIRRAEAEGLADRLLGIGAATAPRLAAAPASEDPADFLYDDDGLPR